MFTIFGDHITDFVRERHRAVVSSVDESGQPHSSVIYYVCRKDTIFFITKSGTIKYQNLVKNAKAAMTITDVQLPIALNMTGTTVLIEENSARDEILQEVFTLAHDDLHDYAPIIKLHKGSFVVFKFQPIEAKLTDFRQPLGKVQEELKNY